MASVRISYVFGSKLSKIKEILTNVLDCMKTNIPDISEDDLFDLRLIYAELLSNAAVHGNNEDETKKIELIIEIEKNEVSAVIRDEGNGFDYQKVLDRGDNPRDLMEERGRGLKMADLLSDGIRFNMAGNEIEFYKKLS